MDGFTAHERKLITEYEGDDALLKKVCAEHRVMQSELIADSYAAAIEGYGDGLQPALISAKREAG